jgi:RNA 3'-terminal phosphate cyclase (ATP)
MLNRSGAGVTSRLERHGFYPAGGGRVVVDIAPAEEFTPIELTRRGPLEGVSARAIVSLIPRLVARRKLDVLRDRLGLSDEVMEIHQVGDAVGAGNAASVELRYQGVTEIFAEIGERGRSAEHVANAIADRVSAYELSDAPVGEHLADQLMVPAAVMGGARFRAAALSLHARTNLAVLESFGCVVRRDGEGVVAIEPIER